ncbi:MAG: hypothetical protein KGJ13_11735 [Patescibacteria group bacterium]|nr:hypothetical protein [Patescibacteria group bacterium]
MEDYQKQGEDFLTRHGLTFKAVLIGSDCPRFCEDAQKMQKMDEINTFPRRSHIHGKHYLCTISRQPERSEFAERFGKPKVEDRPFVVDFWNSYADEEFNAKKSRSISWHDTTGEWAKMKKQPFRIPTAYDVLACVQKSDPGMFEDFCADFGYDTDSRRAFEVYTAVQEEAAKVRRFFTAEELEELQEIN